MRRAYTDLSRGQMHYRYAGEGRPLLMLHMSGSSSDEFEKAGELLSKRYRVYAPDLFGFGSSGKPEVYLSVTEHMEATREFCESLSIRKANVCGNLVGANIACRLAAAAPDLVDRLALFHVCCHPDPCHYKNLRYSPVFSQVPLSGDGSHLLELWARSVKYGESVSVTDDRVKCLHQAGSLGESLHWALCDDTDFPRCLREIKAHSVVYAYDFMDTAAAAYGAGLIPDCRFEILKSATPYLSRVDPRFFALKVVQALG